jgi:pyrimidine deaminase RibD-like protein
LRKYLGQLRHQALVISLLDPDPRNNGRGIEILEQAGIHVEVGLCSDKVNAFLAPYLSKA